MYEFWTDEQLKVWLCTNMMGGFGLGLGLYMITCVGYYMKKAFMMLARPPAS